ncbi:MAG: class I SAM-dependent methyltransferase [Ignavibacteria bacterium]|nr:class I SAM-dependent methyltransferase [Ignavibacteria bacterium]
MIKTDYNKIAPTYNARYTANYLVNIENEIQNIISSNNYKNILEAGCGTGRWIRSIENENTKVFGLDYSFDMLKIHGVNQPNLNLVNADAVHIPFKNNFFDLIFCVNAIHHFPDKEKFIHECKRALLNNGMLAVFGVDPHIDKGWYVYDYFDSVYENDLRRFLSLEFLKRLLAAETFEDIEVKIAEQIYKKRIGNDVFNDPFLEKHHCSQLANLSDAEHKKGIARIKKKIEQDPKTIFTTSVIFYLISAKKK